MSDGAVVRAVESAPVRRKQPKRSRICCYSEQAANMVLERLAEGQSLTEVTAPGDVPGKREILAWVSENYRDFAHRYAHARDTGLDVRAERLMEIARTEPDVNRAKLLCDNEKWLLSKLAPKRYGDRLTLSGDEKSPLHLSVGRAVASLSPEDRAEIERRLSRTSEKALSSDNADFTK